jgi:hypothetical protein
MYSIDIPVVTYRQLYNEWYYNYDGTDDFTDYIRRAYPDVLSCHPDSVNSTYRTFVFESEEHYHWFLLKVS